MAGQSKAAAARPLARTFGGFVNHFYTVACGSTKGKLLLSLWAFFSALSGSWGVYQKAMRLRRGKEAKATAEKEKKKAADAADASAASSTTTTATEIENAQAAAAEKKRKSQGHTRVSLLEQLRPLLRVAFPSLFGKASAYLVLYTAALVARIMLTIKIATLVGRLGRMVGAKTFDDMFSQQVTFALWCFPAAGVNAMLHFSQSMLSMALRKNITDYVHSLYFGQMIFYRAFNLSTSRMDVDQRIATDTHKATKQLVEVYGNVVKPTLEVVLYSQTLARKMGWRQLSIFFLYFIFNSQWLQFISPPFSSWTAAQQHLEGAFRSAHTRLVTYSEEVAFYGGADNERETISRSFDAVERLHDRRTLAQFVQDSYTQYLTKFGGTMVAYSMLLPAVYLGTHGLAGQSAAAIMEYYLTSTQLFLNLGNACKSLVMNMKRMQTMSGLSVRVTELLELVEAASRNESEKRIVASARANAACTGVPPRIVEGDDIRFERVDIVSPTSELLIADLNFTVARGSNVLVSGPNGSGKSSLFRVLGGLWPLCSGTLTRPAAAQLYFIAQKPYICEGSLVDQLIYPHRSASDGVDDARLQEAIEAVALRGVVEREGLLSVREWFDVLSGGEKQRVAMARLFYHRCAFGVLDECTSAVSADVESALYTKCKELGITIFTISHRKDLRHYHDYELRFTGGYETSWQWIKVHGDDGGEVLAQH